MGVSGTQHRMKRSRVIQKISRLGAMSALFKNIEEQARSLNVEDRAKLAESMLETLHTSITEIEAAWAEEIEERVIAFVRGEIPAYSAKEVLDYPCSSASLSTRSGRGPQQQAAFNNRSVIAASLNRRLKRKQKAPRYRLLYFLKFKA